MRKESLPVVTLLSTIVLLSCSPAPMVSVRIQKPAQMYLPDVKTIAIADFQGSNGSGSQIATLTQSMLMAAQYYDIMERDKLRLVLEEQNLGLSGIVDQATAVEVGKLLGVDALIFGEVATYKVEPDERGVEKVERKVGTGKYEVVEKKNIFTGKKYKAKEEIMKTVLVDQHYRIRRGTVAINFRAVGVETGQLLAAHSDSKSYNSGKVVEGSWETLKPEGQILSDLSRDICQRFVQLIAPYYWTEKRIIEPGKGNTNVGAKYAQSGLWPEALESWKRAVVEMPKESAGFYNLGLAYEVQGDYDEAEQKYQSALGLKQKKLYMEALARVRKLKTEQKALEEQLRDREEE